MCCLFCVESSFSCCSIHSWRLNFKSQVTAFFSFLPFTPCTPANQSLATAYQTIETTRHYLSPQWSQKYQIVGPKVNYCICFVICSEVQRECFAPLLFCRWKIGSENLCLDLVAKRQLYLFLGAWSVGLQLWMLMCWTASWLIDCLLLR